MLVALLDSLKFLIESLILLLIVTFFFALQGLHLFSGLFRLRCFDYETGIIANLSKVCGFE
jgi:hypothetical protein